MGRMESILCGDEGTLGRQLGQSRFIPKKDLLLLTGKSDLYDPCACMGEGPCRDRCHGRLYMS